MQIYSVLFALSRQINKQKVRERFNFLYAGNKDFVKYQAQGGVNPNPPPCVRPCTEILAQATFEFYIMYFNPSITMSTVKFINEII